MNDLPQTGKQVRNVLVEHLGLHRYIPVKYTAGLCKYDSNPINFTLIVDDFGVKYITKANVLRLHKKSQQRLQSNYILVRQTLIRHVPSLELYQQTH